MISRIFIDNLATIEHLELEFKNGLNIITGETGAGKSVLVEALSLGLGARADSTLIRSGTDKAAVQIICEYEGEEYILAREINANGKNICRINDKIVTLTYLADFAQKIADIHGQYDNQSLLNPNNHLILLDAFAPDISESKLKLKSLYDEYIRIKKEYQSELALQNEHTEKHDFWRFAYSEIMSAHITDDEDTSLEEQITFLKNSEKIHSHLSTAYSELNSDASGSSVIASVGNAMRSLGEICEYHKQIEQAYGDISESYYIIEAAVDVIRDVLDELSYSGNELDNAIERLQLIESLKKKYGGSIAAIKKYSEELKQKLESADDFDTNIKALESQLGSQKQLLVDAASALSNKRIEIGEKLSAKIQKEMEELNFKDARFHIKFNKKQSLNENGMDEAEFFMSTNRGEDIRPLAKTASGGEMSRIMLAFKKVLANYDSIPTIVFDEIDTGISGATAAVIGKKMAELSATHQLICITHLPQIAAYGDANYKIEKCSDEFRTYTSVTSLDAKEKIAEIARLIGGMEVTDKTLATAEELVQKCRD